MKEIIAVIRSNKLGRTKRALADAGFPAYTCRKVMGRGKKVIDPTFFQLGIEEEELSATPVGEFLAGVSRLISKRLITMFVPDEHVQPIVDILIEANSEGNSGDGKIFVLPVGEDYRIRDGEKQTNVDEY